MLVPNNKHTIIIINTIPSSKTGNHPPSYHPTYGERPKSIRQLAKWSLGRYLEG